MTAGSHNAIVTTMTTTTTISTVLFLGMRTTCFYFYPFRHIKLTVYAATSGGVICAEIDTAPSMRSNAAR